MVCRAIIGAMINNVARGFSDLSTIMPTPDLKMFWFIIGHGDDGKRLLDHVSMIQKCFQIRYLKDFYLILGK